MAIAPLKGLQEVVNNLNKEIAKIEGAGLEGLLEAGMVVRAEAQKKCPVVTGNLKNSAFVNWSGGTMTKVAGAFRDLNKGGGEAEARTRERAAVIPESHGRIGKGGVVEIGFSAVYAVAVHENPRSGKTGGVAPRGRTGSKTAGLGDISVPIVYPKGTYATRGEWKFLENALKENVSRIISIITRAARIRKGK